jgi:acetylornithine deacetylase/succinyl-diaminopimelate desuccinylase-like protein
LRAALLLDDPERAVDVERRLVEPERALDLRAVDPELRELALDLRAVDFRALDPLLRELALDLRAVEPRELELRELELRELDPDDLRPEPPPDARLRDDEDPLLLPLFDSAIAFLLLRSLQLCRCCAPHYMPTVAVTYA